MNPAFPLAWRIHIPPGTGTATVESKANSFRSCSPGRVTGESVPLHAGRRMLVWQTSIYGPDGKRVALVTQTQLVVPAAHGTPPSDAVGQPFSAVISAGP